MAERRRHGNGGGEEAAARRLRLRAAAPIQRRLRARSAARCESMRAVQRLQGVRARAQAWQKTCTRAAPQARASACLVAPAHRWTRREERLSVDGQTCGTWDARGSVIQRRLAERAATNKAGRGRRGRDDKVRWKIGRKASCRGRQRAARSCPARAKGGWLAGAPGAEDKRRRSNARRQRGRASPAAPRVTLAERLTLAERQTLFLSLARHFPY